MTLFPTFFLDFSLLCTQSFLCGHKQESSNASSIVSILESSTLLHLASNNPRLKSRISLNGFPFRSLSEMPLPDHYASYSLSFCQRPHFRVCLSPSSVHPYHSPHSLLVVPCFMSLYPASILWLIIVLNSSVSVFNPFVIPEEA